MILEKFLTKIEKKLKATDPIVAESDIQMLIACVRELKAQRDSLMEAEKGHVKKMKRFESELSRITSAKASE